MNTPDRITALFRRPKWLTVPHLNWLIGRVAWLTLQLLSDPVVLTSLFAPFTIIICLKLASANLLLLGQKDDILVLFSMKQFPGTIDYIIQLFSAALSFFALIVVSFRDVIIPVCVRKKAVSDEEMDAFIDGNTRELVFIIYFLIIVVVGLWLFFSGAADAAVLKAYAERNIRLGDLVAPLPTRILLLRLMIALGGVWLMILRSRGIRNSAVQPGIAQLA